MREFLKDGRRKTELSVSLNTIVGDKIYVPDTFNSASMILIALCILGEHQGTPDRFNFIGFCIRIRIIN